MFVNYHLEIIVDIIQSLYHKGWSCDAQRRTNVIHCKCVLGVWEIFQADQINKCEICTILYVMLYVIYMLLTRFWCNSNTAHAVYLCVQWGSVILYIICITYCKMTILHSICLCVCWEERGWIYCIVNVSSIS